MKKKRELFCLLCLFSFSFIWSQDFPTLAEIYDFKPDDEFHFLHYYCCNEMAFQLETWTIEEKYYNNEGFGYTFQKSIFDFLMTTPPQLVDTSLFNETDSLYIAFPDSVLFNIHDEVEVNQAIYNGQEVYIHTFWVFDLLKKEKYVRGVGRVYNGWITQVDSACEIIDSLIYYSKGVESWGNTLLRATEPSLKVAFSFFPNPTRGSLNISINDPTVQIHSMSIVNTNGKTQIFKRFSSPIQNRFYQLDCSNLEKGLYFIYFSTGESILTYKFIKI